MTATEDNIGSLLEVGGKTGTGDNRFRVSGQAGAIRFQLHARQPYVAL
jgi:hypothetical protein